MGVSIVKIVDSIINEAITELKELKHVKYSIGISVNNSDEKYLVDSNGLQVFKNYHYEIGSITKLFTGLLLSKAIVSGKVNLDDKISKYIELDENEGYPTIQEIMTHTAGLELEETEEYLPKENPFNYMDLDYVKKELNRYKRRKKIYSFNYSNLGAALICIVLEVVNQKPYHVQNKELLDEIGLHETYCLNPVRDLEGVNDKNELFGNWDWLETSVFQAAGCMVSTTSDMLDFGRFILNSEADYVVHMKQTRYKEFYNNDELEVGSFILKYPKYNVLYHDGGTGCFHSALCMYDNGLVLTVLSNKYLDITGKSFGYGYEIYKKLNKGYS